MIRTRIAFVGLGLLAGLTLGCGDNSPSSPSSSGGAAQSAATDSSVSAPSLQSPATGEAVTDLQPTLQIGNSTGGAGTRTYTIEIATDSGFQQRAVSESGIQEGLGGITKWRVDEPLKPETKYFWRARAVTSAGNGPLSSVSEFRVREAVINREGGSLVVFDPLTGGSSAGEVMGGRFVNGGWQPQSNSDCLRYQIPTLPEGRIEFTTTKLSTPNPVPGKRMLISMWDPTKGEYTDNPFRVHLQKLDRSTAKFDDVRLRWISRGEEHNTGISFFDFEPQLVYEWRMEWGTFPGNQFQHVKVFLDGIEILSRNYSRTYHPKTHWVELGNCEREETLEGAIFSNLRITTR